MLLKVSIYNSNNILLQPHRSSGIFPTYLYPSIIPKFQPDTHVLCTSCLFSLVKVWDIRSSQLSWNVLMLHMVPLGGGWAVYLRERPCQKMRKMQQNAIEQEIRYCLHLFALHTQTPSVSFYSRVCHAMSWFLTLPLPLLLGTYFGKITNVDELKTWCS